MPRGGSEYFPNESWKRKFPPAWNYSFDEQFFFFPPLLFFFREIFFSRGGIERERERGVRSRKRRGGKFIKLHLMTNFQVSNVGSPLQLLGKSCKAGTRMRKVGNCRREIFISARNNAANLPHESSSKSLFPRPPRQIFRGLISTNSTVSFRSVLSTKAKAVESD